MTNDERDADELRDLVLKRTGLTRDRLVCPREKSDMTPCLARDGHLVVVYDEADDAICVGCEAGLDHLLRDERARHDALLREHGGPA